LQDFPAEMARIARDHNTFVITSHVHLDGDAVGSEVALYHLLSCLGKKACIVNDGPVPEVYRFLPGLSEALCDPDKSLNDAEVLFVLDSPNLERIGGTLAKLTQPVLVVNIDHHPDNTRFGALNLTSTEASSVGELIYQICEQAPFAVTREMAVALYTALVTDTGRFCHQNTTAESFRVAGELVRLGVSPREVARQLYQNGTAAALKLHALALASVEFHHGGKSSTVELTRQAFEQTGTEPIDTQEFANIPMTVKGVEVGILLREETTPDKVKVSLRSAGVVDVKQVAIAFAGGGHEMASGCLVDGSMSKAKALLLAAVKRRLDEPGKA